MFTGAFILQRNVFLTASPICHVHTVSATCRWTEGPGISHLHGADSRPSIRSVPFLASSLCPPRDVENHSRAPSSVSPLQAPALHKCHTQIHSENQGGKIKCSTYAHPLTSHHESHLKHALPNPAQNQTSETVTMTQTLNSPTWLVEYS